MKTDVLSMFPDELCALALSLGEKSYRGKQIYEGLMRGATSFAQIRNIPTSLVNALDECCEIRALKLEQMLVSKLDGTVKFLFVTIDGEAIEGVFMRYEHGNTLCVSTQAGCRMGCAFCASTKNGFSRNLTPSEILSQVIVAQNATKEQVSNIVLMGIGEPLDNYDNTIKFLKLVNCPDGLNIGLRHISLSTCGLVDKIEQLAHEGLPVTLSVSLHAATDERRKELMPIANKYSLAQLLKACRDYFDVTGRRISFEYALIAGVNDSVADAHTLGKLLSGSQSHVNLIPVNPVKEKNYEKSEKNAILLFTETVKTYKIQVTVRRTLGSDINASCGQLRAKKLEERRP